MKKKTETCWWTWNDGDYDTSCGSVFDFDGYDVDTNAYKFCPGCGRKIEVKDEE